jgi:hypothetical protein
MSLVMIILTRLFCVKVRYIIVILFFTLFQVDIILNQGINHLLLLMN